MPNPSGMNACLAAVRQAEKAEFPTPTVAMTIGWRGYHWALKEAKRKHQPFKETINDETGCYMLQICGAVYVSFDRRTSA